MEREKLRFPESSMKIKIRTDSTKVPKQLWIKIRENELEINGCSPHEKIM
jgi:hypothetical protein